MSFPGEDSPNKSELDPWRVILSHLFEIDSYKIPGIIDAAGMTVDWHLTERQDHSHKYRKAAYRPRIDQAYEGLNDDDRLRVVYIVCQKLADEGYANELNESLQNIGWRVDGGKLRPLTRTVRELFFPHGSQHDAYVRIREIIRRANSSLQIVDPYLDETVFKIIGDVQGQFSVKLLGAKFPKDFMHEASRFQQQHQKLQLDIRKSRKFHDRFIVIDESKCWHIGCSIKDAGNRAFMLSEIEDSNNTKALLENLSSEWDRASVVSQN